MNYEIKIVPKLDNEGKTYWTAYYPEVEGVVGGGDTPQEAMLEAEENLNFYLEYLHEQNKALPEEHKQTSYNGKIALRTSKSNHRRLVELAEEEGVSLNSLINSAIDCYLGKKEYDLKLNQKLDELEKKYTK